MTICTKVDKTRPSNYHIKAGVSDIEQYGLAFCGRKVLIKKG